MRVLRALLLVVMTCVMATACQTAPNKKDSSSTPAANHWDGEKLNIAGATTTLVYEPAHRAGDFRVFIINRKLVKGGEHHLKTGEHCIFGATNKSDEPGAIEQYRSSKVSMQFDLPDDGTYELTMLGVKIEHPDIVDLPASYELYEQADAHAIAIHTRKQLPTKEWKAMLRNTDTGVILPVRLTNNDTCLAIDYSARQSAELWTRGLLEVLAQILYFKL